MPGLKTRKTVRIETSWRMRVSDYVNALAWSPDGCIVAAAVVGGPIVLFDECGEVLSILPGHDFGTAALSWSPDGTLASAGQDGKVRLWDARSGEERLVLDGGSLWVEKVAWSPDGRFLVSAAGRVLRMYKTDGQLLWESPVHESTVTDVGWRPGSSKELASAAYGGLTLWRPGSPEPARRFRWKGSTLKIAWSPNGKYVATGDQDATVHLWITKSGKDLQMYGYPTKVRELSWNSTSRYIATGGGPVVTVWDCSGKGPAGTEPRVLEAHQDTLSALAFQRAGPLLASGSRDGLVVLWNPGGRKTRVPVENLGSAVTGLAWSPDDRKVAASCEDGTVTVLYAP